MAPDKTDLSAVRRSRAIDNQRANTRSPCGSPSSHSDPEDQLSQTRKMVRDTRNKLYRREIERTAYLSNDPHRTMAEFAGSAKIIQGLAHNFPMAFFPQAEPLVPETLRQLPMDAIRHLLDAKRAGVRTRHSEIQVMRQQIREKEKQILLLKALISSHENCLQVSEVQQQQVEDFVKIQAKEAAAEAAALKAGAPDAAGPSKWEMQHMVIDHYDSDAHSNEYDSGEAHSHDDPTELPSSDVSA